MKKKDGMKKASAVAVSVVMAASLNMPMVALADETEGVSSDQAQPTVVDETTDDAPFADREILPANGDEMESEPNQVLGEGFDAMPDIALLSNEGAGSVEEDEADNTETGSSTVATVGDAEYDSLREAINVAIQGDGTVILEQDVTLSSPLSVDSGSVTLDLNGKVVSSAESFAANCMIKVASGAALTINDTVGSGSVTANTSLATVWTNGTLNLQGGTIANTASGGRGVFVSLEGSLFNMTGGAVTSIGEGIRAQNNGDVNVSGGAVESRGLDALVLLGSNASLSGDAQLKGYYGVTLYNYAVVDGKGPIDNVEGATPSSFAMNGGSIDCAVYAISGNNLQSATCSAEVTGGRITSTEDVAIYWPMEGNLTISGGEITGKTGIEAKMGTIAIIGGTLTGTGEYCTAYTGNGCVADGSAIKLIGQLYGATEGQFIYDPNLKVSITGGTLESTCGNAVSVYSEQNNTAHGGSQLEASVTVSDAVEMISADGHDPIRVLTKNTGFSFEGSSVKTGNTTISNGGIVHNAVLSAEKTYRDQGNQLIETGITALYSSVSNAINAATKSDPATDDINLTLVQNSSEDVTIPEGENVTIDFNGKTLSGTITNNGTLGFAGKGLLEGQVVGEQPSGGSQVETVVAKIGEAPYSSLDAAISAAEDNTETTITLVANIVESVTIPANKVITLDLAGHTITNVKGDHTVTVEKGGTLTVTGEGTVDNITDARGALVNYGTVTVEGGTFTRSAEASTGPTVSGGNSWYVIDNHGEMTFDNGTVTNKGYYSSLIRNTDEGVLTINGGTFKNHFIALKNEENATLTVYGGEIESEEQSLQNWGKATLDGGALTGRVAAWDTGEGGRSSTTIAGDVTIDGDVQAINFQGAKVGPKVEITGGTITGRVFKATHDGSTGTMETDATAETSTIQISGGNFKKPVDDALFKDGFGYEQRDDGYVASNLEEGQYLVGKFKVDADDPSTWTYPSEDGQVFAGWYSDAGCTQPYTKTSGPAYAKFVEEADVIQFQGGSLRMDHYQNGDGSADYNKTDLRFGYVIQAPDDIEEGSLSWLWKYGSVNNEAEYQVTGKNFIKVDNGIRSNLLLTGAAAAQYDADIWAQLSISFKTCDGTTVSLTEGDRQTRSVMGVVDAILKTEAAPQAERDYAQGLKEAYEAVSSSN